MANYAAGCVGGDQQPADCCWAGDIQFSQGRLHVHLLSHVNYFYLHFIHHCIYLSTQTQGSYTDNCKLKKCISSYKLYEQFLCVTIGIAKVNAWGGGLFIFLYFAQQPLFCLIISQSILIFFSHVDSSQDADFRGTLIIFNQNLSKMFRRKHQ